MVRFDMRLERGLFQGDSLSHLLFCLCILPLSHALRGLGRGFRAYTLREPITHLLFTDDLKVYVSSSSELQVVVELVDKVSEAMGMTLELRQCAVAHMHKGAGLEGEWVTLTEGRAVEALHGSDIYKYLGIKQLVDHRHKTVREELTREYKRRMVTTIMVVGTELKA